MKIYCPLCHKKVEVENPVIRDIQANYGTRKMAEGMCPKHHKPVATFISSNPQPEKKVAKKRKTSKGSQYSTWW